MSYISHHFMLHKEMTIKSISFSGTVKLIIHRLKQYKNTKHELKDMMYL